MKGSEVWEYLWLQLPLGPQLNETLNAMGQLGWEAVNAGYDGTTGVYVLMKRPLASE